MGAVDEVTERMVGTLLGGIEMATIALGSRLGCWAAVDVAGPAGIDADGLARATGIHPRYAREWLESMGAAGLLNHAEGTFALADGVREVLVDTDSEAYLLPLLRQMAAAAGSLRSLEAAYRSGGGVGWAEHDPDVRDQQGDGNRVPLRRFLPTWVRDTLPEVTKRLEAGGRAADVGCGYGWASVGLAEAFPTATVDGYDVDVPSVEAARRNAAEAGVGDRVTVHEGTIIAGSGNGRGGYDLAVLAEMLHDVPDPVGLLRSVGSALAPEGVALVADMKVADSYRAPAEEVERLMYGFSLLVCLPDSMCTVGSAATGTVIRPSTLRRYAAEAGARKVDELNVEHDLWRFWALRW